LLAPEIETRIVALNRRISQDSRLGRQFCVGHSYVTPANALDEGTTSTWFRQVVTTEIVPLLEEYWFDSPEDIQKARQILLDGWP
jgi:5-methylcytosine-specific restriction protein B